MSPRLSRARRRVASTSLRRTRRPRYRRLTPSTSPGVASGRSAPIATPSSSASNARVVSTRFWLGSIGESSTARPHSGLRSPVRAVPVRARARPTSFQLGEPEDEVAVLSIARRLSRLRTSDSRGQLDRRTRHPVLLPADQRAEHDAERLGASLPKSLSPRRSTPNRDHESSPSSSDGRRDPVLRGELERVVTRVLSKLRPSHWYIMTSLIFCRGPRDVTAVWLSAAVRVWRHPVVSAGRSRRARHREVGVTDDG